ncbi:MAG TPA: response regulator [Gemmatimonadaceae bacterium]|nr:response regulator [Gemmatimonadaceae bacterium]
MAQRGQSSRRRVLVIDDEPSICKALEIILRRAGYDVVTVGTGETATSLLREARFDAMLVDLRIPDMRGDVIFELAAAIQPHLRTATLFMTGDITERASRLIEACRCPTLAKPFDLQDVLDGVAALMPEAEVASA